jgi:hypothetical protein
MSLNTYRLSNEQLLLVNILNSMYYDNLRHINLITETVNSLVDSNNQIRILLTQMLNSNQNFYNNNTTGNNNSNNSSNNNSNSNSNNISNTRRNYNNNTNTNRRWENTQNNSERIMINNRPYIVDSVHEYTIPRNRRNNRSSDELFTQILNNFLQPVLIYPTQSQIETATRRVRYCDISRPINTSCPISMEDFNDNDMVTIIRHCGHTFHTENLMNWFRSNCRCPVCRYDIRDYNTTTTSEFYNSQNTNSSTITDSSNNNLERVNNQDISVNETFDDIIHDNFDNLLNITGLLDSSGNYTNTSADTIAMFLANVLNRSQTRR